MKIRTNMVHGRLWVKPETANEHEKLQQYCLGRPIPLKQEEGFSISDTLVNRILLEMPINVERPVYTKQMVQLPAGYTLRDYQERDLIKMGNLPYALNANIPGYGKTLEALLWAQMAGAERILVIALKSAKYQWQKMCGFWNTFADIEVSPTSGILTGRHSVVTNFEQLYDARRFEQLKGVHWDALIVDEVHKIRNPNKTRKDKRGKIAGKTVTGIINELPGVLRQGLTGSPIYDRPDDLYSICNWLSPYYVGSSYWDFVNLFCEIKEDYWGRKPAGLTKDPVAVQLLKDTLDCFMVRNTEDLGIGNQEIVIPIELTSQQKKLYKQIKDLAIEELDLQGISIANGMSQLIKLQQVTSNPGLFNLKENPKFEWIEDFLDSNPGEKILVFSTFRQTILAFNEVCAKYGVATIHGQVSAYDREQEKQRFIKQQKVRVLSGTIGAMGESIDELQHACRTVIFIDREWPPEKNNQAKRRILRLGQEDFVSVYILEAMNTVDGKVGRVLIEKIEDIVEVLGSC